MLLALFVFFAAADFQAFASINNLRNVAIDASGLLIIAVGMTYVIITSGIDLSVGAILVFASVVAGKVMGAMGGEGVSVWLGGAIAALVAGALWGGINGFLITRAKITPLIATLGTLGMAQGSAFLLTGGTNIRDVPIGLVITVGNGELFGTIPYLVLFATVVTIVGIVVLRFTRFGRYTYAIGSSEEATRRAGINVGVHLFKVYLISGVLSGMAGFLSLARFATTSIAGHSTDNLQAIAAVVLGGTSLFGGIGSVIGTVAGVFIPAVLQNGFIIMGVQPFWQQVAVGAVLILAVYIDQIRRRARELE